jgi:hypothetical protein
MTVVNGYTTLEDAYLAKSLLAEEGIDSQVLDEAASVAPHLLLASGIRLAVADDDDAPRAREILGLSAVLKVVPKAPSQPILMVLVMAAAILTVLFFGIQRNRQFDGDTANRTDLDRNRDGKADERCEYGGNGQVRTAYADDNFDGRWDFKQKFEGGIVASSEQDLDFDGQFDSVFEYKQGVPTIETIRPGGEGHPLFRHEFRQGVLVVTWSDKDRDGRWDERLEFDAMGTEIRRIVLK